MKPVGSLVRLTYDGPPLREGDYLRTHTTGRLYLAMRVRVQEKGKHRGRQHISAIVVDRNHVVEPDARVRPIHWHPRGRQR